MLSSGRKGRYFVLSESVLWWWGVSEEKEIKGELLAKRGPTKGREEEVARKQKREKEGVWQFKEI